MLSCGAVAGCASYDGHVSDSSSVHHQQFFTVYTAVYTRLLTTGEHYQDGRPDPARKLFDIYHCFVHIKKTADDGQRNCPKHVEFYSKNTFEKSVHLLDFIVRIYHDARSPERQICGI